MMHQIPGLFGRNESTWKDHGVKGHIVLAHKLIQVDRIISLFPPLFPFWCVASGNAGISNRSVKPHIENLFDSLMHEFYGVLNLVLELF